MFEQIILILLAVLFLIVLPIISTYKYWNYKPFIKYVFILMWISYGVISYEVFFPRDSYYINHLKKASNLEFTDNLIIKDKYTSLLNSKARYYSCAVFEISGENKKLFSSLNIENVASVKSLDKVNRCSEILNPLYNNSSLVSFKNVDEKNYREWGFIKNSNQVYFLYKFYGMANKE